MTPDEIDDEAYGLVEDHLDAGIEFLTVSETLWDQGYEDVSDEDIRAVFEAANAKIQELKRHL